MMGADTFRAASACVEQIYELAGARLSAPPGLGGLAVALLGPDGVAYDRRVADPPHATLVLPSKGAACRILVSPKISVEDTTLALGSGLARWAIGLGMCSPMMGRELAYGLILPGPALTMAVRVHELDVSEIAAAYRCHHQIVVTQLEIVAPDQIWRRS